MRSNDLSKAIWKLLATLCEDTNLGAIKCILHGAAFFFFSWSGQGQHLHDTLPQMSV